MGIHEVKCGTSKGHEDRGRRLLSEVYSPLQPCFTACKDGQTETVGLWNNPEEENGEQSRVRDPGTLMRHRNGVSILQ